MIYQLQMLSLIKDTLEDMGHKYYSHEAMMLIYNTGLVESKYKYFVKIFVLEQILLVQVLARLIVLQLYIMNHY